jgi:hypothetical protein
MSVLLGIYELRNKRKIRNKPSLTIPLLQPGGDPFFYRPATGFLSDWGREALPCNGREGQINALLVPVPGEQIADLSPGETRFGGAHCCKYCIGDWKKFATHLRRRDLTIVPSGQTAILVENSNIGFCGQAGCALYLFVQTENSTFAQVLGSEGGLGTLERVSVLENVTKGHYDISVTWKDGKTRSVYQWDGSQYSN